MSDFGAVAGGTAAAISTLDRLDKFLKSARKANKQLQIADVLNRIPSDAFELAGELVAQVDKLQQKCLDVGIDMGRTIKDLESDKSYWRLRQYKVVESIGPRINAINVSVGRLLDDLVALSHCSESEQLIANSFAESHQKNSEMTKFVSNPDASVKVVLDALRQRASEIRATLGDIRLGS